jgi:hypothetical protein
VGTGIGSGPGIGIAAIALLFWLVGVFQKDERRSRTEGERIDAKILNCAMANLDREQGEQDEEEEDMPPEYIPSSESVADGSRAESAVYDEATQGPIS